MAPHLGAVFVQCRPGAEVSLGLTRSATNCNTRGGQQHLSLPVPPRVDACAVVATCFTVFSCNRLCRLDFVYFWCKHTRVQGMNSAV